MRQGSKYSYQPAAARRGSCAVPSSWSPLPRTRRLVLRAASQTRRRGPGTGERNTQSGRRCAGWSRSVSRWRAARWCRGPCSFLSAAGGSLRPTTPQRHVRCAPGARPPYDDPFDTRPVVLHHRGRNRPGQLEEGVQHNRGPSRPVAIDLAEIRSCSFADWFRAACSMASLCVSSLIAASCSRVHHQKCQVHRPHPVPSSGPCVRRPAVAPGRTGDGRRAVDCVDTRTDDTGRRSRHGRVRLSRRACRSVRDRTDGACAVSWIKGTGSRRTGSSAACGGAELQKRGAADEKCGAESDDASASPALCGGPETGSSAALSGVAGFTETRATSAGITSRHVLGRCCRGRACSTMRPAKARLSRHASPCAHRSRSRPRWWSPTARHLNRHQRIVSQG